VGMGRQGELRHQAGASLSKAGPAAAIFWQLDGCWLTLPRGTLAPGLLKT
jgi:hypothetical protein